MTNASALRHSSFCIRHSPSGFTLVEIIIALTIVAVLAAATIPMLKGFNDERLAREPVAALVKLAGFSCARRIRLQAQEPAALDELLTELNERRALA